MTTYLLQLQPRYEARRDPLTGVWQVLENGRPMATTESEADARFLSQSADARRATLVKPIGPMVIIQATES